MTFRSISLLGIVAIFSLSAFGQAILGYSSNLNERDGVYSGTASFNVSPYLPRTITNAPYSGERVSENTQTLADGTHITRPVMRQEKTWRDSQGRVRTERPMFGPRRDPDAPAPIAEISDPVAGYVYVLDNVSKIAHRVKVDQRPQGGRGPATLPTGASTMSTVATMIGGGGGGAGAPASVGVISGSLPVPQVQANRRPRPQVTEEDLGSKTIDGVTVTGTRRTTVIPEGQQGNDRPMTTTSETWTSKELGLMVLSINYNPASGTNTMRIDHLSTAEPDPSLFMPPADYQLVDEQPEFTIKWGNQ